MRNWLIERFLPFVLFCSVTLAGVSVDFSISPEAPISPATITLSVSSDFTSPVVVVLEVTLDNGANWRPLRTSPATVAVTPGTPASIFWDASTDLGFHTSSATVRATPTGGSALEKSVSIPRDQILKQVARKVDHHMIHYGDFTGWHMDVAKRHQLVVAHPAQFSATREQIKSIQQGVDPIDAADDAIVLCYISVGEDLRTAGMTDAQFAADPRFRGNGQGPRVDPRPGGVGPLTGLNPLGLPSPGGIGWASWYLDDNSLVTKTGLGIPDRNQIFHGAFVNAGDPAWFATLQHMLFDTQDHLFGIDELLTTTVGRGLGCDGLFLDTYDTCAPNYYTDPSSPNMSKFEWTAAGFRDFLVRLRSVYPDKVLLQNRGLFFFNPLLPNYQVTTAGLQDFLLLESFRLNSNGGFSPQFFTDNLYNFAPKLMAEANRPNGFKVLSLGYVAGSGMSTNTLLDQATLGMETMLEDIRVAEMVVGMRHYLTNAAVDLPNAFVSEHSNTSKGAGFDWEPPVWTSTYNPNPWPAQPPLARVGIQKVLKTSETSVQLYWDVAMDLNRVSYVVYYQPIPFDWSSKTPLANAKRVVMTPVKPWDYAASWNTYANAYDLGGLTNGTWYFLIRAVDGSPQKNEDWNTVTLSVMLGNGVAPPWTAPTPPSPSTAPAIIATTTPTPTTTTPAPTTLPPAPSTPPPLPPASGSGCVGLTSTGCGRDDSASGSNDTTGGSGSLPNCPQIFIKEPAAVALSAPADALFNATFVPAGGTSPYTIAISDSSLPSSLQFNGDHANLVGTPMTPGNYTFTLTITDSSGCQSAPLHYDLTVTAPPPATTTLSPTQTPGRTLPPPTVTHVPLIDIPVSTSTRICALLMSLVVSSVLRSLLL